MAKTMKEVLEEMAAISKSLNALEERRSTEADPANIKIIDEEITSKNEEFELKEKEANKLREKARRDELMKSLEAQENVVGKVKDVVITKSEHNMLNEQRQKDMVCKAYIVGGDKEIGSIVRDKGENLINACKRITKEKPEGEMLMPSYMRDHVLYNTFLRNKGSYDVLTSDASGSQSGGGSLVPDTYVPELYKLPQITDRLIDECMVKRAIGGSAYFPRLDQSTNRWGVAAAWGSEGAAMTEDNPVFNRVPISTNRLTCLTQLSKKELRVNNVGLDAELATMFRGATNDMMTRAILTGSGSGQPIGINTNYSIGQGVVEETRATTNQIAYGDVSDLQYDVESGAVQDGIFVVSVGSTGAMRYLAGLVDSEGRPLIRQDALSGIGPTMTMCGSRVIQTPNNTAALGNRGDVIYGAFRNYGVVVDEEMTIERSDEYAFNTGLVTFRVMAYIGGQPLGYSCFAVLGDASGASSSSSSST